MSPTMGWLRMISDTAGENAAGDPPPAPESVEYREIGDEDLVCGRSPRADWTVSDKTMSREHARFFRDGDGDYVEDLGSTNGTSINGARLREPQVLADGDEIRLGDRRFTYELLPPVHLAETPVPTGASTWTVDDIVPESAADGSSADASSGVEPSPPAGPSPIEGEVAPLRDTERWHDVTLIGRGGMGEVYRALDRDLATLVAIKRLRRRGDGSRGILERLHAREAAIARTIRHPNVVQVLEDGVHDGDPYMLLEWIEGPTFDRYLIEKGVAIGDKIECLRQVSLGLAAAHRAGVVHADMKPANILVSAATGQRPRDNLGILEAPDAELIDESDPDEALQREIALRLGTPEIPDFAAVPFVGREGEIALLEDIVGEVRQDAAERRWVLLYGERGAGKRRLASELQAQLADRGSTVRIEIDQDGQPPPDEFTGLWLSLLPPLLPDMPELLAAYEREQLAGSLREIYLKPFLRGQSIRLVEKVVQHAPSARAFIDAVDAEVGGNPARLLARLERSFEQKAWVISGAGYRFRAEVLSPDDQAVARRLLDELPREEKGLRDFLSAISPLGSNLDFATMLAASELPSATLYYVIDHAVQAGYITKDAAGDCAISVEPFRAVLEKRLDAKERLKIGKRALPHLHERLASGTAPAALHLRVGRIERQLGHLDKSFRVLLHGALRARESYQRDLFLACIDEAREIYRETSSKRGVQKSIAHTLESFLGGEGRGYAGLERLRRLPTAVRVHLTDFGIARKLVAGETTRQDDDGQPWGTPRYMSPEQARRSALSPASDVFSLGTIIREAFEGRHPLGKLRGRAAIVAVAAGKVTAPPSDREGAVVPASLRDLVTRMLAPDPKDRPEAEEVARGLEQFQLHAADQVYP